MARDCMLVGLVLVSQAAMIASPRLVYRKYGSMISGHKDQPYKCTCKIKV